MKKKYQISIPDPCQEDWNEMPINGKGRDCSKCEKNIRDFTKMSDNELIALLKSEENVCGRFSEDQLDRPLLRENRGLIPTFNLYAVAAGFGVLITFPSLASDSRYEKAPVNLAEVLQGEQSIPLDEIREFEDSLTQFLVVDDYRYHRIVGANIRLFDDQGKLIDAIQTDDEGHASYSFALMEKHRIHKIKISANDKFEEKTIVWTPDGDQQLVILLESTEEEDRPVFMGIAVRPED